MNETKWDALADAWLSGTMPPANGMTAWYGQAIIEADLIRSILPPEVRSITEVGCGVGRLTPYLAQRFDRVEAVDTSARMIDACELACHGTENVSFCVIADGFMPAAGMDAALVWGNLYDEDWSLAEAADHFCALSLVNRFVIVQTLRRDICSLIAEDGPTPIAEGDDWFLLGDFPMPMPPPFPADDEGKP